MNLRGMGPMPKFCPIQDTEVATYLELRLVLFTTVSVGILSRKPK